MTRKLSKWLLLVGVGWMGACEDKQCKSDLQACANKTAELQKQLQAAQSENASLKPRVAKLDELIAQVAALTMENEKLKATPAPPSKPAKH